MKERYLKRRLESIRLKMKKREWYAGHCEAWIVYSDAITERLPVIEREAWKLFGECASRAQLYERDERIKKYWGMWW